VPLFAWLGFSSCFFFSFESTLKHICVCIWLTISSINQCLWLQTLKGIRRSIKREKKKLFETGSLIFSEKYINQHMHEHAPPLPSFQSLPLSLDRRPSKLIYINNDILCFFFAFKLFKVLLVMIACKIIFISHISY